MQSALTGTPTVDFPNVITLEQQAAEHHVNVDTPDTAPTEDEPGAPRAKPPDTPSPPKTTAATAPVASPTP
jgi:hypothetical protein